MNAKRTAKKFINALHRSIPSHLALPVLRGPLKGSRFVSGNCLPKVFLGNLPVKNLGQLNQAVKPGQTVFQIGEKTGVLTTLLSKLVGSEGRVIVFGCDSENIAAIEKQIIINKTYNVTCFQTKVTSIDDLVTKNKIPAPQTIVVAPGSSNQTYLSTCSNILTQFKPAVLNA